MSDQSKLGIGKVITSEQHRDAIHVAVAPVRAAHVLKPGDHVGLNEKQEAVTFAKPIGIVDPFLMETVKQGDLFWLLLYPGSITSLRHEWEHPSFRVLKLTEEVALDIDPMSVSRRWIEDFAAGLDQTVNRLMDAAEQWLECEEYTYDNSEVYKSYWEEFPEFWKHYEIVTGKEVPYNKRDNFFTCSC